MQEWLILMPTITISNSCIKVSNIYDVYTTFFIHSRTQFNNAEISTNIQDVK